MNQRIFVGAVGVSLICVAAVTLVWADLGAGFETEDRIRIGEAHRIVGQLGDNLWPGLSDAPFAVLLVTPEREFLVYHPSPTIDFAKIGHDSLLACDVFARDRIFDINLLATFPAVDGVPTAVIGQPKNTEASHSTRWVATLIHEHFHQYQQSQPDYYPESDALGLAELDTTGMWMLNYPFPYDSKEINTSFRVMCRCLGEAVDAINDASFPKRLEAYLEARRNFTNDLSEKDHAYFSFQVWQEGIARYTEYKLIKQAAGVYTPTSEFAKLPDRVSFEEDANRTLDHIVSELYSVSLKKARRTAFYHVGAAEGLLLDRANPGWRRYYMTNKFFTEKYFDIESY